MQTCYQELTDSQWEIIEKMIASQRVRQHSLRRICNLILWIVYTGSQWRSLNKLKELDSTYPAWQSVYYYFRKWQQEGVWEQILDTLVVTQRLRKGRKSSPSLLAMDSQSVKKVAFIHLDTGIDGAKYVNGRKRHLAVDMLGLPWAIRVTAATISDTAAGSQLLESLKGKVPRLEKITADHGYKPSFVQQANLYGWIAEIVQKPESAQGFVPQKNRWVVERSFAWLTFRRRLSKDYEKTIESSEAMLQIAFISFLLNRI